MPTVVEHRLYVDTEKTRKEVDVGEEVEFKGYARLSEPLSTKMWAVLYVYVNGSAEYRDRWVLSPGTKEITYSFSLTFHEPGTYNVYADLFLELYGAPPYPPI